MSFGVTELIIIAVIVLLLFGTTKLKSLGSDLGGAIKEQFTGVISPEGEVSISGSYVDEGKTEKISYFGRISNPINPTETRTAILQGDDGSGACQVTLTSQ